MKSKAIFASLIAALALGATTQAADTYRIDPAHSSVGFSITHLVISTVKGKFKDFSGEVSLDGKDITAAKGIIQTKSIDTSNDRRDGHLRSADFFNAEKFPTITFESKRVEKKGNETVLIGDYSMHGVTKELALPVKVNGPVKDPWGNSRIGIQAKATISRKDYGISWNQTLETGGVALSDEVEIEINAEATKMAAK
jgi:polyisoprenoid-binding protein YceI